MGPDIGFRVWKVADTDEEIIDRSNEVCIETMRGVKNIKVNKYDCILKEKSGKRSDGFDIRGYFAGSDLIMRLKIYSRVNWLMIKDYSGFTYCDVMLAHIKRGFFSRALRDFLLNVYKNNLGYAPHIERLTPNQEEIVK
jgi:hypothetical protein